MTNKNTLIKDCIIFVYGILILAALIFRARLGVEITDEAYYAAEPYLITKGAIPFVNMWMFQCGFAYIMTPFVWMFNMITGGTEGIILYLRLISIFVKLSFVLLSAYLLRKNLNYHDTTLYLLPFLALAPYSLMIFSYNTLSQLLLFLAGILLTTSFSANNRLAAIIRSVFSGICMAFSIISYPSLIITGALLAVIILIVARKFNKYHIFFAFLIGGFATAILFLMNLIASGGSLDSLISGLVIMFSDTPGSSMIVKLNQYGLSIFYKKMILWIVFTAICSYIINSMLNKYKKLFLSGIYLLLSFCFIYAYIKTRFNGNMLNDYICYLLFPFPLVLLQIIKQHKAFCLKLLLFVWCPSLSFFLTVNFTTPGGGIDTRYYMLCAGSLLTILFLSLAQEETYKDTSNKVLQYIPKLVVSALFSVVFIINYYGYVYREMPLYHLTYKINNGVYRGLYTFPQRGRGLIALEDKMRELIVKKDTVMFRDNVPMAWLMCDAKFCTSSAWDLQSYSYGYMEDTLLQKYFRVTKTTPNKIFYIFTGRDKILSIDNPNYQFNKFVKANYQLAYRDDTAYFPVRMYVKKTRSRDK